MDYPKAIQLNALHAVVKHDNEYMIRYILRWYSKTFFTPLHIVETLPFQDILQHYWETYYEDREAPEIEDDIKELTETPEEKASREEKEKVKKDKDEEFFKKAKQKAEAEKNKKSMEKAAANLKDTIKQLSQLPSLSIENVDKIDLDEEPSPMLKKKPKKDTKDEW